MSLIEIVDLTQRHGSKTTLSSISLSIEKSEILAIIGPTGAGKTTLLRLIDQIDTPASGKVLFDGIEVTRRLRTNVRRQISMVLQKPVVFDASVYDNVAYGPRIHGMARGSRLDQIVEDSLRSTALWSDLKDRLQDSALALSPEQQQRLCISRLVAVEPEVLLMDEPCSALDPIATAHIEELMRQLAQRYTIVIVTHNMQQAARVSQETGFMLLGDLVEFGATQGIFTAPADKRTEDYVTGRYG